MNLQPLLDLKGRLENAAIAGVGLLGEDFRLKRAAEGLKPLAAASPVFAKIDQSVQGLISAPSEERSGRLLDTLALVDAVLYTQGTAGASVRADAPTGGELVPMPLKEGVYQELSYNQLHPLLEALTGSGGGRMGQIQEAWENRKEIFSDYRVLPKVIDGLGESYAELADLNGEILKAQGMGIIPRLKEGFDPAGKKEMARRVRVIEELAGAAENDWYLEQLSKAKKTVREALIVALRHEPANGEKLWELCQTEKKDCQAAAYLALARCDTEAAVGYLRQLAKKNQDQVMQYLQHSPTAWAAQLTGELFCENMAFFQENPNIPLNQEIANQLNWLRLALEGKTGPEIQEAYRQAAKLGTVLDRDMEVERNGQKKREPMGFWCFNLSFNNNDSSHRPFSGTIPAAMMSTIQRTNDPGLCALANQLFQEYGGDWALPALSAAFMNLGTEEAYRRGMEILSYASFDGKKPVVRRILLVGITWRLYWHGDTGRYEYSLYFSEPATANWVNRSWEERPCLAAPLDPRWYDLLIDENMDSVLENLLPEGNEEICGKLGPYFYKRALFTRNQRNLRQCVGVLVACGWTDWDDFLFKCLKNRPEELNYYTVMNLLQMMPISDKERAVQLRKADQLAHSVIGRRHPISWPSAVIEKQLADWES